MGTWSVKPFGNDTALDWLNELKKSRNGSSIITNAIESIIDKYDGTSGKAEEAMAAISIITASINDPVKGTNTDAKTWIITSGFVPDFPLIEKAISALNIITTDSELFELWSETSSLATWLNDADKIRKCLLNTKENKLPVRKPKKKGIPRSFYKLLKYYEINPEEKIREKIRLKIEGFKDVNEANKDTDYSLPLTLLSKYGLFEEVKYILSRGANPNHYSLTGGAGAFTYACVNNHLNVADLLLKSGAECFNETIINETTGDIYNPELYISSDTSLKLKTHKYCAALFSVASLGKPEAIDFLVSKGANIHQIDLNGETLIHKACRNNNIESLQHLIKQGVDVNISKGIINGNKNSRGETALHFAVGQSNIDMIKLLIENNANPNTTEYFYGKRHNWENTPLDLADKMNDSKIYQFLVKNGAKHAKELIKT